MQISRRNCSKLWGSAALFLAVGGSPFLVMGCGVFSDILAWTNVAGVAIDGIVTALGSFMPPGGAQIVTAIKAFLADLAGAVTEYQNDTNPADRATLLAKIRTLLGDVATNFQNLLSQLNIGGTPVANIVLGLAQVILAAIMGFLGQLPAGATLLPATITVGGKPPFMNQSVSVTPKYYRHVQAFKADYNAVCAANGHMELEIH